MSERYVRLEAAWPDNLAETNITLKSLGANPKGGARWVLGKNEIGQTVIGSFRDVHNSWLVGGTTGAGKTEALRSCLYQLASQLDVRLLLLDGKFGAGLGLLENAANLVGPLAKTPEDIRRALSWAVNEMRRRYEHPQGISPRLVICFDEPQEILSNDPASANLLRRLVALGRERDMSTIVATQHPTSKDAFGGTAAKRNLGARLALTVGDYTASDAVVGGPQPRADYLLMKGDSYVVVPGAVHRTQLCYVPTRDFDDLERCEPPMSEWPEFDGNAGGNLPSGSGNGFDDEELAISIVGAANGKGRPWLQKAIEQSGRPKPGSGRAERLLKKGRRIYAAIQGFQGKDG